MTETTAPATAHTRKGAGIYSSLVVFALALLAGLLSFSVYPALELYDNGIIVSGADAILQGKLPYKDFWTMYAPGQFYLVALLFRIFEPQLFIACLIGIVSKAVMVTLGYMMLRRHLSVHTKWLPAVGTVILALFLARMGNETFPAFPAAALSMLALMLMERGLAQRRLALLLAAGAVTGLAACFRHDMGAYTAVALTLGTTFVLKTLQVGAGDILKALGVYIAGLCAIAAPVAAFFLVNVPAHDLYENLVHIPSAIYPDVRRLPWAGAAMLQKTLASMKSSTYPMHTLISGIREFVVYVPFLIGFPGLCISAFSVWQNRKSGKTQGSALPFMFLASLLCLLMTLKGTIRPSPHHLAQSIVLAVPVGVLMLPLVKQAKVTGKLFLIGCLSLACIPLVATDIGGYNGVRAGLKNLGAANNFFKRCETPASPRLRCMMAYHPYDKRNVIAADFLRQRTPPDKPIYVGAGRHDKIFWNAVMMYFMAERPAATKWAELHPGVQTRAETQQQMIEEMRRTPPSILMLDEAWDRVYENNLSSKSSGVHILDKWLGKCYVEAARFETIHLMVPRADGGDYCGGAPALAPFSAPKGKTDATEAEVAP
ncbi:MAG: hypothetical protein IKH84_03775 [Ottowia sp.]|nr:hypothetical protein [Ottowia sp.]